MKYLFFLYLSLLIGCTSTPHSDGLSEYEDIIDSNSAGEKVFDGAYESFDFRATILSKPILTSIIDRKTQLYQWDEATRKQKLDELITKLEGKTSLFVSFFTPNRADNNLDSKKSIWMIYLDTQGNRYSGKAVKNTTHMTELKSLFPYHTRWANGYDVIFDLPLDNFVKSGSKVTITGPLGKREVTFE